jgi:GABA(A) receptor-associated protein
MGDWPKLDPDEFFRLSQNHPDRIPIFVRKAKGCKSNIPEIPKSKFLVPRMLTIGQFIYIIRRQLTLSSETALFFFVEGTLPTTSATIVELYQQYKQPDGSLHVEYTSESVFGFCGEVCLKTPALLNTE